MGLLTLLRDGGGVAAVVEPPVVLAPAPTPPTLPEHQPKQPEATVRLQVLDGVWETLGADRLRGVVPEGVTCAANPWGFDTANFQVRRDPEVPSPDLSALTPCEIHEAGRMIWEGRIQETPSSQGEDDVMAVSGRGYQYHLDDDVLERVWVHSRLQDWIDRRSMPEADLSPIGTAAGQVETGDRGIVFGWPKGTQMVTATADPYAGVALDLGEGAATDALRVSIDFISPGHTGAANLFDFIIVGAGYDATGDAFEDVAYTADINGISTTVTAKVSRTFDFGCRYVFLLLRYVGAVGTIGEDNLIRVVGARVYRKTAYESNNQSILKASDVIRDLPPAFPLLSADLSGIADTAFPLPDVSAREPRTGREVAEAVNAFHRWQTKVGPGKRMIFEAQKTVPKFVVGSWGNRNFDDASANSAEEIYNHVIAVGTDPTGTPLRVERWAAQQPGVALEPVASPAFVNSGFETDLSGWTIPTGFARSLTYADQGAASGRLQAKYKPKVTTVLTGTFLRGTGYVVEFRARASDEDYAERVDRTRGSLSLGVGDDVVKTDFPAVDWNGFTTVTVSWVPKADRTGVAFALTTPSGHGGSSDYLYIDSFSIRAAKPTLVDRRGFVKTKILSLSAPMTVDAARQVADVFLQAHMKTPLKGQATYRPGDLRSYESGAEVHPRELADQSGELIHFSHLTDPDTGAAGRDGVIAAPAYNVDEQSIQVTIDNQRDNLEALLARYALVAG